MAAIGGDYLGRPALTDAGPFLGRSTTGCVAIVVAFVYLRVSPIIEETREWPSFMIPLCGGLMLVVLAARLAEGRHPVEIMGPATVAVSMLLALFLAVRLPGLLHAGDGEVLVEGMVALTKDCFVAIAIVFAAERTRSGLKATVWGVVAAGAILSALAVHKLATGAIGNDYAGFSRSAEALVTASENGIRYTGPFDDPNFFAQTLTIAVAMAVARFWRTTSLVERLSMASTIGLCLVAIGLSLSRGGLMASGVVIVTSIVFRFGRWALFLVIFFGAAITGLVPGSVIDRLGSVAEAPGALIGSEAVDPSIQGRTSETLVAVSMFLDHPVLGVGYANYEPNYLSYSSEIGLDGRRTERAAHNLFLEAAAELGAFGLAGFLGFVGAAVALPGRVRRRCRAAGNLDAMATAEALQLAAVGYLLTAVFLHDAFTRSFIVLMALSIGSLMLDESAATENVVPAKPPPPVAKPKPDPAALVGLASDLGLSALAGPPAPRSRPLRVVQIIDSLGFGGAERLVAELASRADRLGFHTEVISLGHPVDSPAERMLHTHGIVVHHAPTPVKHGLLDQTRARRLSRLLRASNPDVVHLHRETATILAGRLARRLGIPTVVTLHDADDVYDERPLRWRLLRRSVLRSDRLVAVGAGMAEGWRDRLGAPVSAILSPAETPPRYLRRGTEQDRVQLITVGSLSEHKAIPDLLAAMATLAATHPMARLLIVGDGPGRDDIEDRIAELGLRSKVRLVGARRDVPELLAQADVFVSSSVSEGLPVVLLEAMAAGLPIVATAVGEVPEVVPPDAGTLIEPGDPDALAAAIAGFIDDSEARRVAGRVGRRRIEVAHDPDKWAEELSGLYRDLGSFAPVVDVDEAQDEDLFLA